VTLSADDVGRSIERAMGRGGISGLSAALIAGGEVAWSEGFGVGREPGRDPVGADTVFAVASLSKPPFAQVVLQLCERGQLDLDTPLAELYPEPYDAYGLDAHAPELQRITARQVLCHTSGLGNWEEDDIGRIGFPPGSRWHYSGEGYVYLQAVVEHVAGSPLEQLAEAELFTPLGMRSTGYLWPRGGSDLSESHEFTRAFAAFSLHTTAPDYARLVADTMHSDTGEGMLAPQVQIDDSLAWGLGWGLAGRVFWHWGDMREFQSVAVASRAEGRGLVVLTNSDRGLGACVEILRDVLGDDFSYPIRTVLERGW
jgi:CubicO group peptidase (beta-lactamase class C family)